MMVSFTMISLQVVTIGVVGGSDFVKISEQLGSSGLSYCQLGFER